MLAHITLIIAHSHPHFLLILQNIIRSYPGIRIIGKANNLADLLHAASTLKPDIIIADVALSGRKGFTAFQKLATGPHQPKVILSWRYHHLPVISKAIDAGFAGCIKHDANPVDYLLAIKQAMKGEVFYCSQTEKIINAYKNRHHAGSGPDEALSDTQLIILYCIWLGYNSKEIGLALGLTKATVDTYRKELRKIIGSGSLSTIARFLEKNGII
jgi:two-component system nitrate/nitrite response regulator NarL